MIPPHLSDLSRRTLAALCWNYGGALIRVASSLAIGILLARLLGPVPFGQVAVAWLLIGFGNLIADFGLSSALVQRPSITSRDIRHVFTLQVLAGLALTSLTLAIAPLLAALLSQPPVTPVIRALSLLFTVQSLGLTASALLKRDLRFRDLQLADVCSYLAGYLAVGLPMAFAGFGVWSLVAAQLSQTSLSTLLCYLRVRHPLRPLFRSGSHDLSSFGFRVLATNSVNWSLSNLDNAFVSRLLGPAALGLYDRSFSLLFMPANSLVSTLQKVLFPAYSRAAAHADPASVRHAYLASVGFLSLLALPIYLSVAIVPHAVVIGLLGPRWLAAVPLIAPLALAVPFHAAMAMAGPMLWATSRVSAELRAQTLSAIALLLALFLTSAISLHALAWAVCAIYAVRCLLVTESALRTLDSSWSDLLRSLRPALLVAAACLPAVSAADQLLPTLHPTLHLLGLAAAGGVTLALSIRYLAPLALSDEMHDLFTLLPSRLQYRLFVRRHRLAPVSSPRDRASSHRYAPRSPANRPELLAEAA